MCHHHDNDFSVDYQGIRLTFGQHSGYSHSYRTTQTQNGVLIDYSVKNWKGIDFSRVDNYGDNRGGTLFTVKGDGSFEITPVYARDVLDNYMTDYYIDYEQSRSRWKTTPTTRAPLRAARNANGKSDAKRSLTVQKGGENRLFVCLAESEPGQTRITVPRNGSRADDGGCAAAARRDVSA